MAATLPVEYPFFKEDGYTDIILVIQGRRLYINGCLLGYPSPHFRRLFNNAKKSVDTSPEKSDTKKPEKTERKRKPVELKINEKEYEDFVELLAFLHPSVCKDLTERTALRLMPLAEEYRMSCLKERCENLLHSSLKRLSINSSTVPKGTPVYKNRKDNAPELLLYCTIAADVANSKTLLEHCIRLWSNPNVPIKDLKASPDISDPIKARIYENRMMHESKKMKNMSSQLEKERNQNEMLQKQLLDTVHQSSKVRSVGRVKRYGSDPSLHTAVQPAQSQSSPRRNTQKVNSSSKDFSKKYAR